MRWPGILVLTVSAGVWLRATETEIIATPWALVAREELCVYGLCFLALHLICQSLSAHSLGDVVASLSFSDVCV